MVGSCLSLIMLTYVCKNDCSVVANICYLHFVFSFYWHYNIFSFHLFVCYLSQWCSRSLSLLFIRRAVLCCQMAIVFSEAGLADIHPPCVVQSFVNHNARLFKIFIVGPRHFVVQRPSIRNCYPGGLSLVSSVAAFKLLIFTVIHVVFAVTFYIWCVV